VSDSTIPLATRCCVQGAVGDKSKGKSTWTNQHGDIHTE